MAIYDEVDASATIYRQGDDNIEISPTEIIYESDRYNSASNLEISGLAGIGDDEASSLPQSEPLNVGITCSINGTLIGSGELESSSVDGEGLWSGTAFDAARKLQRNTVTRSKGGTHIDACRDIFQAADIDRGLNDPNVNGLPQYVLEVPDEVEAAMSGERGPLYLTHYRGTRGFDGVTCAEALTQVLRDVAWEWWISAGNVVHVAEQIPTEVIDVPYVTETSAGKQTPPFQQVEVTGDRSSEEEDPAAAPGANSSEYLISKGPPVRATSGDGRPIFPFTDRSITTEQQAQDTADSIMRELLRQQRGGSVTIVGQEEIRPLDAIVLPDHLGGETYLASTVTHEVSNSNGFTTTIGCGGLLDPGEGGRFNEEDVGEEATVDSEGGTVEGDPQVGPEDTAAGSGQVQ